MPADMKRKQADYVIDNTGSHHDLEDRIADVWRSLSKDAERQKTN
jgi:dephospho-CoA kinase